MAWQQAPETVAVQDVVRTQRLEVTNAEGEVVAVLSAVNADPDIVTGYHPNGVKRFQVRVRDNKFEGTYTQWSLWGTKSEEGDYKDGKRHGLWREWRGSTVTAQGAYADGRPTGIWIRWSYRTGEKVSEGERDDGESVGNWRFWNNDGSIDQEKTGFYEDGVKIR